VSIFSALSRFETNTRSVVICFAGHSGCGNYRSVRPAEAAKMDHPAPAFADVVGTRTIPAPMDRREEGAAQGLQRGIPGHSRFHAATAAGAATG
jgi:hypothetical protein